MTQYNELRVFKEARRNIRHISMLCKDVQGFGDLLNQLKRSAVSVASNIAEGIGDSSGKQVFRFLQIARASNRELHAQLLIVQDLNPEMEFENTVENVVYVGKMLTKLSQYVNAYHKPPG